MLSLSVCLVLYYMYRLIPWPMMLLEKVIKQKPIELSTLSGLRFLSILAELFPLLHSLLAFIHFQITLLYHLLWQLLVLLIFLFIFLSKKQVLFEDFNTSIMAEFLFDML